MIGHKKESGRYNAAMKADVVKSLRNLLQRLQSFRDSL